MSNHRLSNVKRILLTGGAGFIGSHVLQQMVETCPQWHFVVIDRLDSSGNLNRLAELNLPMDRVKFIYHDLKSPITGQLAYQIGHIDSIMHLAAATHVDRSIEDPMSFVMDNVVATCSLLNYARTLPYLQSFLYFSTDEVFGPAPEGVAYREWDRYKSGNPYAATKAGGEELALAFHNTYKLPVIITHTMNVVGTMQHPEKFVPMTISKVRDSRTVTIHSDKTRTKAGSRHYISVRDVAGALIFLMSASDGFREFGGKYNIVGVKEINNLQMARMIATAMNKPLDYEMVDFHSSRPGHDLRYALDGSLMASLGWRPSIDIYDEIKHIVDWSLKNDHWLSPPQPRLRVTA